MLNCAVNSKRVGEMGRVVFSRSAKDNIDAISSYIAISNDTAARRFIEAAYETVETIAEMSGIGVKRKFIHSKAREVRSFRVKGYGNYLIFYTPITGGIRVIAIAHGARDLDSILNEQ